jgi:uncharacterized membrane protein
MKNTQKSKNNIIFLSRAAIIAALYVVLTLISGLLGLDGKGVIQVRISEALCILPLFTSAAIPGVTFGCLIYNIFFASPLDAVFGTIASLIGVLITYYVPLFKKHIFLAGIPTVLSNTVIIPFVISFAYLNEGLAGVPFLALTVFIGELIACSIFGSILYYSIKPYKNIFFGKQ